jgi:undecaprenyl phosphate-alpha-L-ara4N flippase subunit ArnE
MILKLLPISLLQCLLLTGGQVLMKFGLQKAGDFSFSWGYFGRLFINWQFASCGVCFAVGSVLWMYIIKNFPLSMAYPMVSLSYVMGMLAAILFFHEQIPLVRWIGVFLILSGCVLIAK